MAVVLVVFPDGKREEFQNVSDVKVENGCATFTQPNPDERSRYRLRQTTTTLPILYSEDIGS